MPRCSIADAVAAAFLTCGMASPVSAIDLPRPTVSLPRPPAPTVSSIHGTAVTGSLGNAGASNTGHTEKLPGRSKWGSITLQRGVVNDKSFSGWAAGVTRSGDATSGNASGRGLRSEYTGVLQQQGRTTVRRDGSVATSTQVSGNPPPGKAGGAAGSIEKWQQTNDALSAAQDRVATETAKQTGAVRSGRHR